MFKGLIIGLYHPGNSLLHRMDPRTKLISLIILIAVVLAETGYLALIMATCFLIACLFLGRIHFSYFIRGLKPVLLFIILTLILHLFFTPGKVVFNFGRVTITKEGIYNGGLMALRLFLLIAFSAVFTITTSPVKITHALEHLLYPLQKLGLPVTQFIMMITIALRFLPTLALEADKTIKAQVSRGARLTEGNVIKRMYSLIPITVPLFISAIKRAEELATAMETRCYTGSKRTVIKRLSFTRRDYLTFGVVGIYLLINLLY